MTKDGFGSEIRIERKECEVALIFVAKDQGRAEALVEMLIEALKAGQLVLEVGGGKPTRIERTVRYDS